MFLLDYLIEILTLDNNCTRNCNTAYCEDLPWYTWPIRIPPCEWPPTPFGCNVRPRSVHCAGIRRWNSVSLQTTSSSRKACKKKVNSVRNGAFRKKGIISLSLTKELSVWIRIYSVHKRHSCRPTGLWLYRELTVDIALPTSAQTSRLHDDISAEETINCDSNYIRDTCQSFSPRDWRDLFSFHANLRKLCEIKSEFNYPIWLFLVSLTHVHESTGKLSHTRDCRLSRSARNANWHSLSLLSELECVLFS